MEKKSTTSFFSLDYTLAIKGIAVLLLLFHHLGANADLGFSSDSPLNLPAYFAKVCVVIFVFLSGYGMSESFNRQKIKTFKQTLLFTLSHLKKLLLNYWLIFIIVLLFGIITKAHTLDLYRPHLYAHLSLDFLGLADLFGTPTFNLTWWFMTLAILLYLLFPLLKSIPKKLLFLPLLFALLISLASPNFIYFGLNQYLFPFILGIIFSNYHLFDKLHSLFSSKITRSTVTTILLTLACVFRFLVNGTLLDNPAEIFLALSIIFFCIEIIIPNLKYTTKSLKFLGIHSGNIFLVHTLIYETFFLDFFLSLNSFFLSFVFLLLFSLIFSVIVEKIKNLQIGSCKVLHKSR